MDLILIALWAVSNIAIVVIGNVCFYYFFGVQIEQEGDE